MINVVLLGMRNPRSRVVPERGLEPLRFRPGILSPLRLPFRHSGPFKSGGDDETRTHYLNNANVTLYQMSYAPTNLKVIIIIQPKKNIRQIIFCARERVFKNDDDNDEN